MKEWLRIWKNAIIISFFKFFGIVFSIITITSYYLGNVEDERFIITIIVVLITSLVSIFMPVIHTTGINWVKIGDVTFHVIVTLCCAFVTHGFREAAEELEKRTNEESAGEPTGTLGIILTVFHAIIVIIIMWRG